jgi:hypothetical protein
MTFHKIMQMPEQPARADKSALGAINRLLLYGLPTSSGGDGQDIVCQASGDMLRLFTARSSYDVVALTH